jgi:predicted permease
MSLWSRTVNVFRGDRLIREIDEELESHLEEAIRQGRDPDEARRALGPALRLREESRDVQLITWLDSLRADAVFGWRQLMKNKVAAAAAILSLALGIGACTGAFRLIDALLLRPLPVDHPEQLYVAGRNGIGPAGTERVSDSFDYPLFRQLRPAVADSAELIAISYAERTDLTFASDEEMEKAYRQYVSGGMFSAFGLRPALGRLFNVDDDRTPGAHPYAVISYDYWTKRFGRDPKVIGRKFRMGSDLFEIVGVGPEGFTGTEPGTMTDIFVPTMMMDADTLASANSSWFRMFVKLEPGASLSTLRDRMHAMVKAVDRERAREAVGMPKRLVDSFLNQTLVLIPAAVGTSGMQEDYRRALVALAVLVALVLLVACANVVNLMMAQAAARAREMALRISIGAGRARLVQLVLMESAWLALLAGILGAGFAWWSAPVVIRMVNPPDDPVRLQLPADWRVLLFGVALTVIVMLLFGLAPALRASAVKLTSALKGGDEPQARRRLMGALVAIQAAFCFVVLFVAGLFVGTFRQLSERPLGFSPERLLALDTVASPAQLPVYWDQVKDQLRAVPGVESVAIAGWSLMNGDMWNNFISINGAHPAAVLTYFLKVSPGWIGVMHVPLIDGRDFRPGDRNPGVAMVNQAFARQHFLGEDPVGKWFETVGPSGVRTRFEIVGLVGDVLYQSIREPVSPQAYIPLPSADSNGALQPADGATLIVRTLGSNPLALAPALRRAVPAARAGFRVSNIRTQAEIDDAQIVRERLLERLALFFGAVALLLGSVGLYGVLNYIVLKRTREIGIRIALGAPPFHVGRCVTADVFAMVLAGALGGLALGFALVRYIQSLLYQVKPTDPRMLALPVLSILAATLVAALPPLISALLIDPATTLRSE